MARAIPNNDERLQAGDGGRGAAAPAGVLVRTAAVALVVGVIGGLLFASGDGTAAQTIADSRSAGDGGNGAEGGGGDRDRAPQTRSHAGTRPNIILFQTDDLAKSLFKPKFLPRTFRLLVERGTSFTNYATTTPVCCPSRAALISGQYNHTNQVVSNGAGYPALINKSRVLPNFLDKAGYKTAHLGKYMQGYEKARGLEPDRGWDKWYTVLEKETYFNYDVSSDGRKIEFGSDPRDHQDTMLGRRADRYVSRFLRRPSPFFMQLDFRAPHLDSNGEEGRCARDGPIPNPSDEDRFQNLKLPMPPNFREKDFEDKPAWVQKAADRKVRRGRITRIYRCGARALLSVDRAIAQVMRRVRQADEADRTIFIFASDNGFTYGEHRLGASKAIPYEEAQQVPMVIRAPARYLTADARPDRGLTEGSPVESDQQTGNIDLAPTILDFARAEPCIGRKCRRLDGRSLLPILRDDLGSWPEDRAIVYEMTSKAGGGFRPCRYRGLRVDGAVLINTLSQSADGEPGCEPTRDWEYYDLDEDPFQLTNTYPGADSDEQDKIKSLRARLRKLSTCSGISGREDKVPKRSFCE